MRSAGLARFRLGPKEAKKDQPNRKETTEQALKPGADGKALRHKEPRRQPADEEVYHAPQAPDTSRLSREGLIRGGGGGGERRRLQQQAGRKLFYPSKRTLQYLDGRLPGDYGWDPLALADPKVQGDDPVMNLDWLSYAELIHGRWAMLAALGAVAPELMSLTGAIPKETGLPWFEAGGLFSASGGIQGIPFLGDIPINYWAHSPTLDFTMLVAMGFAETARYMEYKEPGWFGRNFKGTEKWMGVSGNAKYPGGIFNFARFGERKQGEMFTLQTKEMKNGRLAMVAWLGFMVQAVGTHRGPIQNLLDHVKDPANTNIFSNIGNFALQHSGRELLPFYLWLVAGFAVGAIYVSASSGADPLDTRLPHDGVLEKERQKEEDRNAPDEEKEDRRVNPEFGAQASSQVKERPREESTAIWGEEMVKV